MRAVLFAASPIVAAGASILVIPSIVLHFGASGWAAIAIGISIGTAMSVIGELGWALDGPARVARIRRGKEGTLYSIALTSKLWLLPFTTTLSAIASWIISPSHSFEAALAGIAGAGLGLSMSWFLIGQARALALIVTDSLPKLLAAATTVVALQWGAPLAIYPLCILTAALASPFLARIGIRHARPTGRMTMRRTKLVILAQRTALRGRVASAVYIALPTAIVGLFAPNAVAAFAAIDRLQRMLLTMLQPVPNILIRWVASAPSVLERERRGTAAANWSSAVGLLSGMVWLAVAPIAVQVLFRDEVVVDAGLIALSSVVVFLTCCSRGTGSVFLISIRRTASVSNSAVSGAIVGAVSVAVLASVLGALGGVLGQVCAEATVLLWQIGALRGHWRFRRS